MAELDEDGGEEAPIDFTDLEGKSVAEVLVEGRKALFIELVGRVRSHKATHQEMAILRNLLRDNGMSLGLVLEAGAEDGVSKAPEQPLPLPDFGDPEYLN